MAKVSFTQNLRRHIGDASGEAHGATVREVLDNLFEAHPAARGYVLDDQQALRKHMMIFVDGLRLQDRSGLSDPVGDGTEIHVFQALSGG